MTPPSPLSGSLVLPAASADKSGVILNRTELAAAAVIVDESAEAARPLAPALPGPEGSPSSRIIGYDLARAVAIFGMLLDHCCQVFGPRGATGWGAAFMRLLDGRPSAVFVVLAGVGVSLMARGHDRAEVRATLFRRGSLLLLLGILNRVVYQGDILRLFGVTMMAAGVLNALSRRALLGLAFGCVLAFPALFVAGHYVPALDFDVNWREDYSFYENAWSVQGIVRGLFYNGYRPVLPWAGLLVFGMWVGRLDVRRAAVRRKVLLWGAVTLALTEAVTRVGLHVWLAHPGGASEDTIRNVFDGGSMPPMPTFVLTATSTALVVIGLCLMAGTRWIGRPAARALGMTGQMALTWYVVHILIGAAVVRRYGWNCFGGSLGVGVTVGAVSFALVVLASAVWRKRFRYGPLEYLLRAVS